MASKSAQAFRTIREVADWLGIEAHVLRFWESKFSQIRPVKRAGGRRYYRPADMALVGGIKVLLHDQGLTIRGVQKMLSEEGVKHVASLSPAIDEGRGEESDMPEAGAAVEAPAPQPAPQNASPDTPPDTIAPAEAGAAESESSAPDDDAPSTDMMPENGPEAEPPMTEEFEFEAPQAAQLPFDLGEEAPSSAAPGAAPDRDDPAAASAESAETDAPETDDAAPAPVAEADSPPKDDAETPSSQPLAELRKLLNHAPSADPLPRAALSQPIERLQSLLERLER